MTSAVMVNLWHLLGIFFVGSIIPSLFYLRQVKARRWPGRSIAPLWVPFAWGAVLATSISLAVNTVCSIILLIFFGVAVAEFLTPVVVAPIVEEPAKGIGNFFFRRWRLQTPEDGIVVGAAAGSGFATVENVWYAVNIFASTGDEVSALVVLIFRGISSTLFHMVASAVVGYGIARGRLGDRGKWIRLLFLAMLLHGLFNLIAGLGSLILMGFLLLGTWFGYSRLGRFHGKKTTTFSQVPIAQPLPD